MLEKRKDPLKDREVFIHRLDGTFQYLPMYEMKDLLHALLYDDEVVKASYKKKYVDYEAQKAMYLEQYDACKTDEERERVVGSVRKI